ncbi:MAG: class C sortase [Ezakiella sp.]|nr:class C sortase [Ezakiella sp.]MDD7471413.1 class C sortase [Bacillota bacterium]MDY3922910.1 class C sortase [Ezakiella sp.]
MKNKNKFIIGRLLMVIGLLIPLLSLTTICVNDMKKKSDYENFVEKESTISNEEREKLKSEIERYNGRVQGIEPGLVDPFTGTDFKARYNIKGEDDEAFSYIRIPKIDVTLPVYLGASYRHLSMGAAHVDGTSLPVGGEGTRSVIAGHRGFYKDTMFLNLHELEKDDMIILRREDDIMFYKVTDSEVINPYDWDKLEVLDKEDMLTLLTCDPITPPSPYRLIVNAKRYYPPQKENVKNTLVKIESEQISSNVKNVKMGVYAATILMWALLIYITVDTILKLKNYKDAGYVAMIDDEEDAAENSETGENKPYTNKEN